MTNSPPPFIFIYSAPQRQGNIFQLYSEDITKQACKNKGWCWTRSKPLLPTRDAWWCPNMEMFSTLLALCGENPRPESNQYCQHQMHDDVMTWTFFHITGPWWGEPLVTSGFPSLRTCYAEHQMHDVMTWKPFPQYWPLVGGIHWSLVDSPHKGPMMQSFDVFFDASMKKLLNQQLSCWWFEMPCSSCDFTIMDSGPYQPSMVWYCQVARIVCHVNILEM